MQNQQAVSNRAAVLPTAGEIVLESRPVPHLGADEVMVQVEAVGLCGSDVHYYRHGRVGRYVVESPLILGHETAGTVVDIGSNVTTHALGDRVAIEPGVPCGNCQQCRTGRYNLCADVAFHATPPVDGTLQKLIAIRADHAFPLPDGVSTEAGALVEPLAVAVWACRKALVSPGSRVIVTGAGPVGLLVAQTARAFGASLVALTDLDLDKLRLGRELGVDVTLAAQDVPGYASAEFDVHIECSGHPGATRDGIQLLARGGTSVLVGMGAEGALDIPVSWIQEKELIVTGVFRYAHCFPLAIELLTKGEVRVEPLITARHPLTETELAITSTGGPGMLKVLINPQL